MSERRELCKIFLESIKDEGPASINYRKVAERLKENDDPEIKVLSILFEKLSQDEMSHKMALDKVARLVCTTR